MVEVPVISIDGPSGSGKGTIATRLARVLGFNYLDSGAIYRTLGIALHKENIGFENITVETKKSMYIKMTRKIIETNEIIRDLIEIFRPRGERAGRPIDSSRSAVGPNRSLDRSRSIGDRSRPVGDRTRPVGDRTRSIPRDVGYHRCVRRHLW